jgi:hypothetical protein
MATKKSMIIVARRDEFDFYKGKLDLDPDRRAMGVALAKRQLILTPILSTAWVGNAGDKPPPGNRKRAVR